VFTGQLANPGVVFRRACCDGEWGTWVFDFKGFCVFGLRRCVVWLVALVCLVAGGLVAGATGLAVGAPGHLRYAVGDDTVMGDVAQAVRRNRVFVFHAWQTDRLRAVKAADPSAIVLVYKNLSAMASSPRVDGVQSTGVGTDNASLHPDWYLLNTSGHRFNYWGYDYLWAADVGNASYEQAWAANVVSELKKNGWDGVFMDDTTLTMKYHYNVDEIAKYRTDGAWQQATKAMLAVISPKIRAAGKKVYANVGAWVEFPGVAGSWLPYLDGAMEEMFLKYTRSYGAGYRGESQWQVQLDALKQTEAAGKVFLALTQSSADDRPAARFGWATTLLGSNGLSDYSMTGGDENEHWYPEYDYAIGTPVGADTIDGNGVRRRVFSKGLVLVNPTAGTLNATFGGIYTGSGLTNATSASMAPHTALILTLPAPSAGPAGATGAGSVGLDAVLDAPSPIAGARSGAGSTAGAPTASTGCIPSRALRYALHAAKGQRVVRVTVKVTGARARVRTGRRLTAITVKGPRRTTFTVTVVSTTNRGVVAKSVRTYKKSGCAKGRVKVTHSRTKRR
jgi:hypothetical protein